MLISNFYPPYVVGGAELMVSYLAKALVAQGCRVTVVSTCGPTDAGRSVESVEDGVRVIRYFPRNLWWNYERFAAGDRRPRLAKLLWNLIDLWNPASRRQIGRILDAVSPDIVHSHNIKGLSPSVWAAARARGIPVVHTTHDYHLVCRRGTMLQRGGATCQSRCSGCLAYGRWFAAQARGVGVVCSPSRHVLDQHRSAAVGAGARYQVIPNGIPGQPTVRTRRGDQTRFRVLFLGQLRHEKGLQTLLEALPLLDAVVDVTVAGKGEMEAEVQAATQRYRMLTFAGFVSGAAKAVLLESADALVFPSIWAENAPLALLEALMQGVPVIGSDIGAVGEIIEHDSNGLLVTPGDGRRLAEVINALAKDPALSRRLSQGATQSARHYTVEAMSHRYVETYRAAGALA